MKASLWWFCEGHLCNSGTFGENTICADLKDNLIEPVKDEDDGQKKSADELQKYDMDYYTEFYYGYDNDEDSPEANSERESNAIVDVETVHSPVDSSNTRTTFDYEDGYLDHKNYYVEQQNLKDNAYIASDNTYASRKYGNDYYNRYMYHTYHDNKGARDNDMRNEQEKSNRKPWQMSRIPQGKTVYYEKIYPYSESVSSSSSTTTSPTTTSFRSITRPAVISPTVPHKNNHKKQPVNTHQIQYNFNRWQPIDWYINVPYSSWYPLGMEWQFELHQRARSDYQYSGRGDYRLSHVSTEIPRPYPDTQTHYKENVKQESESYGGENLMTEHGYKNPKTDQPNSVQTKSWYVSESNHGVHDATDNIRKNNKMTPYLKDQHGEGYGDRQNVQTKLLPAEVIISTEDTAGGEDDKSVHDDTLSKDALSYTYDYTEYYMPGK